MEPKIVTREAFNVMGVLTRIKPDATDYQSIWCNRFDPVHDEVKAFSAGDGYYGVYYGTSEPGMVDFVAGMMVGDVATVPEGLVLRIVPAAEFAVFECPMQALGATWGAIYREWLPSSKEYVGDETKACFEYFPPETEGGEIGAVIWVPVKPRGSG
jgi:predicted transcriptional regulator YdeE